MAQQGKEAGNAATTGHSPVQTEAWEQTPEYAEWKDGEADRQAADEAWAAEHRGDDPDEATDDYDSWSKDELSDEAEKRGLPHSGTKDEIATRLRDDDKG